MLAGVEPRTYVLWRTRLNATVAGLAVSSDGQVAFCLLELASSWRLLALNITDGSPLALGPERKGIPQRVASADGVVLVLANGSLTVLNATLGVVWERLWPGQEVKLIGIAEGNRAYLLVGTTLACLSLEGPELAWSRELGPADELALCCLPERGLLVLKLAEGNWTACEIRPDGLKLPERQIKWLSWAREASLTPYNATHILLAASNATHQHLALVRVPDLEPTWSLRLPPGPRGLSALKVLHDLDGDGSPELLLWSSGCLKLLSGSTGLALHELEHPDPVTSCLSLSRRFLLLLGPGGLAELLELRPERPELIPRWRLTLVSHAAIAPDLDGDGSPEVLLARGDAVECAWGSYDDGAPIIECLWPPDGASTSIPEVVLMARVRDAQSGLKVVRFLVDGVPREAHLDRASGLYVARVRLEPGWHKWWVEAEDRVGHVSRSPKARLAVNLSFFGQPGWLDDLIFFAPWLAALAGLAALMYREKHRAREPAISPRSP